MTFNRRPGYVHTVEDSLAAVASLFNSPAEITEVDDSTVDATYGAEEQAVIGSLRTSLNELLAALEAAGVINIVQGS